MVVDIAAKYRGKTLEDIVEGWKGELKKQATRFEEEAEGVAKWERQVLKSQKEIRS